MFVELAQAVENAGGVLTAPERLNEVQDVRELLTVVDRQPAQGAKRETPTARGEWKNRGRSERSALPPLRAWFADPRFSFLRAG
jgi:hypothetical protein